MEKIVRTMKQLRELVSKSQAIGEKKKQQYLQKLDELMEKYDRLPEEKGTDGLYNLIIDSGVAAQVELKKSKADKSGVEAKTGYFLRLAAASYYDYSGDGNGAARCIRMVMWMSAMGLVMASMVYGVPGTIILIIPIIFALLKLKKRDSTGIIASYVVMGGSVVAAAVWIYYLFSNLTLNWGSFIDNAMKTSWVSQPIAVIMVSLIYILPFAVIALVVITHFVVKKYKEMFI